MLPTFLFQFCCKNYRYRCYNFPLKYTPFLSIFFYRHFPRYYQKLFQRRPYAPPRSFLQKDATYLNTNYKLKNTLFLLWRIQNISIRSVRKSIDN
jgi:uncharacterized membrane protein YbaN (DUF454 family)